MSEKLIKPQTVAEMMGFHARTVADMGKRGEIPGAVIIGRHVRFDARSVREFLERGGGLRRGTEQADPLDSMVQMK